MKKSKMVANIDNYLCSLLFKEVRLEPDGSWDSYSVAKELLELIESKGMRPPNVCGSLGKDWDDGKFAAHFHMAKDVYYWEDE